MYKITTILFFVLLLGGCAREATYVDHEFGKAQNDAFDQQIAYKKGEYADQVHTSMPGIHSEKIMDTYQNSFDRDADNKSNFTKGPPSSSDSED